METSEESLDQNSKPLTSSVEDTPASPSAKQGNEQVKQTSGIFGQSSRASFAYFDPDSCCWKTCQATFLSGLEVFSETWPDSGTTQNGSAFELQISERPTCESGSSSWPTPDAQLMNDGADPVAHAERLERLKAKHGNGNGAGTPLAQKAMNWPTAHREDGESAGNHPGATDSLTGATRNWITPHGMHGGRNLADDVTLWATPNCPNGGRVMSEEDVLNKGATDKGKRQVGLEMQAKFFPTPSARDYRSEKGGEKTLEHFNRPAGPSLPAFLEHSPQARQILDGPTSSPKDPTSRRRLNPRFVEWLMGFPPGWTEL